MKRIILSIIFSLFFLVGGLFFITKNFSHTHIQTKNFITAKGSGENLYKFKTPFKIGESLINIVKELEESIQEIESIYIMKNKKWIKGNKDEKIYQNIIIKVKFISS